MLKEFDKGQREKYNLKCCIIRVALKIKTLGGIRMKEKKQNNVEIGIRRKEIAIIFIVIFIRSCFDFNISLKEKV